MSKNYGITLTPYGKAHLESREYVQAAEADFDAFLAGGRPDSIKNEITNVGGSIADVLEKTNYRGAVANDDSVRLRP